MSDFNAIYLVLLFLCLVLSAFFSSSETAFIALQRIRVKHLVSTEVSGAARIAKMMERPERFLATILLGNNLINTAAAALGTIIALSIFSDMWGEGNAVLIATIGVTILLLIFGEITPKTIATQHAERMALLYIRPIEGISWLLSPFATVLSWIGSGLSKIVGGTPVPKSLVSEEEIHTVISMGLEEGTVEEAEAEMLHKVFEFGDRPVREAMVPRPDIAWLEQGMKLSDFLGIYRQQPYSRFPVYEDNLDNVVGVLSIKDVLMAQANGSIDEESNIDDLVRPVYFAPETKRIGELFAEMRQKNYRIAVVVDEFGGTAGIANLEGLVEEIVGRLGDEFAAAGEEFEVINEHTFLIDGGMHVREANDELDLHLPLGNYETVAGFVLSLLGHIPKQGEQLRHANLKLVIAEMQGVKIEKILVTKEEDATSSSQI